MGKVSTYTYNVSAVSCSLLRCAKLSTHHLLSVSIIVTVVVSLVMVTTGSVVESATVKVSSSFFKEIVIVYSNCETCFIRSTLK